MNGMQEFAADPHDDSDFWQPAPLLARLDESGSRLAADEVPG